MGEWVLEAISSLPQAYSWDCEKCSGTSRNPGLKPGSHTFFCRCENATSAGDNALDHSQDAQGLVTALLLASVTALKEKCNIPGPQCF